MLRIYSPNENGFNHNGLAVLQASAAEVSEELNGPFELTVTCPVYKNGKALSYLSDDYIIKADTPRGDQLFRIYKTAKKLDGAITINARHIFYDNLYNLVEAASGEELTADEAIKLIFSSTAMPHKFNAASTIAPELRQSISLSDVNPVSAIFRTDTREGTEQAGLIQLYGGELSRDNFNITLMPSIGEERGFTVRYRKNLTGLSLTQNDEDVCTRIKPVGRTADDGNLYLPEKYVDSPNIGLYFMPRIAVLDCAGARVEKGKMTEAQAFDEMRAQAMRLFEGGADVPKINAKVDFVLLSKTEEYKSYSVLETVYLGDVVSVIHEELGIRLLAKCVKYRYNCLLGKYEAVELGDFNERLSQSIERGAAVKAEVVSSALMVHMRNSSVHISAAEREALLNAETGLNEASEDVAELRSELSGHIGGFAHLNSEERLWLERAMTIYPVDGEEV